MGEETLLKRCEKGIRIGSTCSSHGRDAPLKRKRTQERDVLPCMTRVRGIGTRPLWCTRLLPGHGEMDSSFIEKDHIVGRARRSRLPVSWPRLLHIVEVLFCRPTRFLLRVR